MDTDLIHLCWLHDDDEPDHWIGPDELVGLVRMDGDQPMPEAGLTPAARQCAEANGVADRIVEWPT